MRDVRLIEVPKTDYHLRGLMTKHYSQPKGFVGRSLCYLILSGDVLYGAIVGGSATLHLPGRNEFLGIDKKSLGTVVNNIFYHVEKVNGRYPFRNFTVEILKAWRERVAIDWRRKYHNTVAGFESLVELPRTRETYLRDGWTETGVTEGNTCKRVAGKGTDSWSGKRVWDTKNLRPKRVFCRRREEWVVTNTISTDATNWLSVVPVQKLSTVPLLLLADLSLERGVMPLLTQSVTTALPSARVEYDWE